MRSGTFPAKHSVLHEAALADLLAARYELRRPVRCRFVRQSMSHAYWIHAERAFLLKVYIRGRHTRQAIEAEVRFINDLHARGIDVACPVPDRDGGYVTTLNAPEGTRYAVLFEGIEGTEPVDTDHEYNVSFGRLAARLHNAADQLGATYERWRLDNEYLVEQALTCLEPHMAHRRQDFEFLCTTGRNLIAEVEGRLPRTAPEYGMVHGDLHPGNTLVDASGRLVLFDFDTCGTGWRVLDVGMIPANHHWLDTSDENARRQERIWTSLLEGYATERTLSAAEFDTAKLGVPLRHFELIGITIRYWTPQLGDYWINDEYFDVHVRWFRWWLETHGGCTP